MASSQHGIGCLQTPREADRSRLYAQSKKQLTEMVCQMNSPNGKRLNVSLAWHSGERA